MFFLLQRLTGGIVIWREGPAVVIYRGKDYVPVWMRKMDLREEAYRKRLQLLDCDEEDESRQLMEEGTSYDCQTNMIQESEIEDLMDDLGPQFVGWIEGGRAPVDGDLLVNSNFNSPFRRLPYGVRPRLTNFEMTEMRHLAKKLPPHFVLGAYVQTTIGSNRHIAHHIFPHGPLFSDAVKFRPCVILVAIAFYCEDCRVSILLA